jgi:hypothetical protein
MAMVQSQRQSTLSRRAGCYELIEELGATLSRRATKGDEILWLSVGEGRVRLQNRLTPGQFLYIGQGIQEIRLILEVSGSSVRIEPLEHGYAAGSPILRPAQYQLSAA